MSKWLVEVIKRPESRDNKIARVNTIRITKSVKFTLIPYRVTVRFEKGNFPCAVNALYTPDLGEVGEQNDKSVSWIPIYC